MSPRATATRHFSLLDALGATAGQQNEMLLIQLRWLAVLGQVATIVLSTLLFGLSLPLAAMFAVVGALVLLNLLTMLRPRRDGEVRNIDLMGGLLLDIAALTALLYFSGGASNPFVFLYLLQLTLAAVLLDTWSTWVLVGIACLCFSLLTRFYVPLDVHASHEQLFGLHVFGMLVCFVIEVVLLMLFLTRINANLRRRDARLAELRQQAAEEQHIVRMGLLASGAAHELGTPLATLAVTLGDWRHMPAFRDDPAMREELDELEAELRRCKSIVSGILMSAGEARGEAPVLTTLAGFLDELTGEWRRAHVQTVLEYRADTLPAGLAATPIVSDIALRQVIHNVLDNAAEAAPERVAMDVSCDDGVLQLQVRDRGPGFAPDLLAQIGKPYQSSKNRPGSGLGLFLVVNVLRKLGGEVCAANLAGGGAEVTLRLPLAALTVGAAVEAGDD